MNAIATTINLFFDPGITLLDQAKNLRNEAIEEDSIGLPARGLFLAQAIVSIVGLVFAILATILLPLAALCTEGGKEASWEILQGMTWVTSMYAALIPTCFIAACTPHSWQCLSPLKETVAGLECIQPPT